MVVKRGRAAAVRDRAAAAADDKVDADAEVSASECLKAIFGVQEHQGLCDESLLDSPDSFC